MDNFEGYGSRFYIKLKEANFIDLETARIRREHVLHFELDKSSKEFYENYTVYAFDVNKVTNEEAEIYKYSDSQPYLSVSNEITIKFKLFKSLKLIGAEELKEVTSEYKVGDLLKNTSPVTFTSHDKIKIIVEPKVLNLVGSDDILSLKSQKEVIKTNIKDINKLIKSIKFPSKPQHDIKILSPDTYEKHYENQLIKEYNNDEDTLRKRDDHQFIIDLPKQAESICEIISKMKTLIENNLKIEPVKIQLQDLRKVLTSYKSNYEKICTTKSYIIHYYADQVTQEYSISDVLTNLLDEMKKEANELYKKVLDAVYEITYQVLKYLQHKLCIDCINIKSSNDIKC